MSKGWEDKKIRVCVLGGEGAISSETELNLHLPKWEIQCLTEKKENQKVNR